MKIRRGCYGGLYIVYPNSIDAGKWDWLWIKIFHRSPANFGQFENAFRIW